MAVGVLGNYVARIYEESKLRPLYVVSASRNLGPHGETPERSLVLQPSSMPAPAEVSGKSLLTWK